MLNPHFWSIAERAGSLGFHLSMITNGLLIRSEGVAQRLKDVGFSALTFSLYSLDPEIHDDLTRVKGSCEKTKRAIEFCKDAGIESYVNCLLTSKNAHTVFELYEWCVERGLDAKVDPVVTSKFDGDLEPTLLRATKDQLREFYLERARRWPNSKPKGFANQFEEYVCNAAKGKCAVTAYGDLLSCIEVREPLGNLAKDDFQTLWNSKIAEKWRNIKFRDLEDTPNGKAYNHCDHCPGMSCNEKGKAHSPVDFINELAEVKANL